MPKGVGCPVVHQLVATVQEAGSAELEHFAVDFRGIHDSTTAKRSIGQGDGHPTYHVVGHLVGIENAQRISPRLSIQ